MSFDNKKKRIIEQVLLLEDEETLDQLERVLKQPSDEWESLDEQEKAGILRGYAQAKEGKGYSEKEMEIMLEKWLSD
jgi:hypothetical protein